MADERKLIEVTGVGKITAAKLEQFGISTVSGLADASVEQLSQVTGFPLVRAAAIQEAARNMLPSVDPVADLLSSIKAKKPKKVARKGDPKKGKKKDKKDKKKEKGKKKEKDKKKKKKSKDKKKKK